MSDLVEVRGACECPSQPHDEDVAYLRPSLGLEGGLAALGVIQRASSGDLTPERAEVELGVSYVLHGLSSWNWTNGTGEAIPITEENIRRGVPWARIYPVADRAAELYGEEVFSPLVARVSKSSARGRTGGSTSATKRSSRERRKR